MSRENKLKGGEWSGSDKLRGLAVSSASPPSDDVVEDKENCHHKQYHVQHPPVVPSTGHGLESLHAAA